jgi:hypothetical protein
VYVSFVHTPGSIHRPSESVPSLLELRHIANHPTMNRRVRHDNAALRHHRRQIPIAQSIGDVPAEAQFDDLGIEPAAPLNGISDNWLGHWASRGRRIVRYCPLRIWRPLDAAVTGYCPLMQRNLECRALVSRCLPYVTADAKFHGSAASRSHMTMTACWGGRFND